MGGSSLKHRVKQQGKMSEAEALGHLKGEAKFDKSPLGKRYNFTQIIEGWIKRIDPLELVAIVSVAQVIKQGIEWTETLTAPTYISLLGIKLIDLPGNINKQALMDMPQAEISQWILSFGVAVIIVRNFSAIATAMSNILNLASTLLGATVKAS